jgi:lipopolysaccharide heptosyltransferase III
VKALNFRNIKKILVIKLRHIGDVLLTVPVFRALRENFPDAHLAALVNSGTEEVLSGNPLIHEIIIFNRNIKKMHSVQKYIEELSFLKTIRKKGFDMIVDLTSGDRAAIISFTSGARYRIAYDPDKSGFLGKRYLYTHLAAKKRGDQHMVLRNLDVVKQFGIDTQNREVNFFISEEARIFVRKILEENNISASLSPPFDSLLTKGGYRRVTGEQGGVKVVHIHPTSRMLFKCWKDEYMTEVIGRLINKGVKVIVTSSPDRHEIERVKRILTLVGSHQSLIDLAGKTTVKQLAAVAEISDLFIGVDSAPMHIAAAVGTPVVALFGAGVSSWRPWGKDHVALLKDTTGRDGISRQERIRRNLSQITPEDVMKEIEKLLFNKT